MNKTDEALAKILNQLSDKFGTTSAHLWQVLLRQAYIDGIEALAGVIFTTVIMIGVLVKLKSSYRVYDNQYDDFSEEHIPLIIISCVTVLAFSITLFAAGSVALECFLNPEYYALHEILKTK